MAITNGLITSAEYGAYVGKAVPSGDRLAQWEESITVASRVVERKITGRQFHKAAVDPDVASARYFDPTGAFVYIDDARTVTEVATCDDAGTYTAVDASNYQLTPVGGRDPLLGLVPYTKIRALRYLWPQYTAREGVVRVTGTWGWTAVPDDVKHATCIITQDLLNDPDSNFGGLAVTDDGVVLAARIPARATILLAPFGRLERTLGIA